MNARPPTRIIYCGLDLTAWDILSRSDRFDILAVNKIPDFLEQRTINPVNILFRRAYAMRTAQYFPSANEMLLSALCEKLGFLATGVYRKYAGYLRQLCLKRLLVLDFGNAEVVADCVKQKNIAMIVVNNWWMLPGKIINAPPRGTINIHPSRLPQYRGSLPTLWTLKNGDRDTAVSFIVLARKMDSGGIIAQYTLPVDPAEDAVSLEGKIEKVLKDNLVTVLENYLDGKCPPVAQREELASSTARYFDYMKIDWAAEKARDIADKINLYPYLWQPHLCWTFLRNRKIFLRKAGVCPENQGFAPPGAGDFRVKGVNLYVRAMDGIVRMRLFRDLDMAQSIALMLERQGKFGEAK